MPFPQVPGAFNINVADGHTTKRDKARHRLCLVCPVPSWPRHGLCLVFPLPLWLRHCLCLADFQEFPLTLVLETPDRQVRNRKAKAVSLATHGSGNTRQRQCLAQARAAAAALPPSAARPPARSTFHPLGRFCLDKGRGF